MNVTLFQSSKQTLPAGDYKLPEILKNIKEGYWADQISKLRQMIDAFGKRSTQVEYAKKALPCFTVSGVFTKRNIAGLVKHSGFVAIDIDNIQDGDFEKVWLSVKLDQYTYSAFRSCSGKGLCIVVKVHDREHDKELFTQFSDYYSSLYGIEIDSLPDVTRLRFVSHDPNLYLQTKAKTFYKNKEAAQQYSPNGSAKKLKAWDEREKYEFAKGVVEKQQSFTEGNRHKFILSLAGFANKCGISQTSLTSFVYADFPHFAANPSNAITWTYSNKSAQHGSFILSPHQATSPNNTIPSVPTKTPEEKKEEEESYLSNLLETRRADWAKPIPEPDPVIKIGKGTISTAGNITVITGHSKSGKSGVMGAVMAGCLASPSMVIDTLGITVMHNDAQKAVIYIDTEQSRYNFDRNYRNVIKRCGLSEAPDFFQAYWLRGLGPREILKATQVLAEYCSTKFGGAHLFVIDGIGDYVKSVNDEEECNLIVEDFAKLAEQHKCPILTVLHFNPGSNKERGHMGSQLQRKAESILTVKKSESEVSTLGYKELRNAGHLNDIEFEWSSEKGYHVLLGGLSATSAKQVQMQKLRSIATPALLSGPMSSPDFIDYIMADTGRAKRTAQGLLSQMKEGGIVALGRDRMYRLVQIDPHTFDPN